MTGLIICVTAFGLFLVVSALANWEWYKGLADFAAVEAVFGESAARWLCGASGLLLLGFGVAQLVGGR